MLNDWKPEGYTVRELAATLKELDSINYGDCRIVVRGGYVEGYIDEKISEVYVDEEDNLIVFDIN